MIEPGKVRAFSFTYAHTKRDQPQGTKTHNNTSLRNALPHTHANLSYLGSHANTRHAAGADEVVQVADLSEALKNMSPSVTPDQIELLAPFLPGYDHEAAEKKKAEKGTKVEKMRKKAERWEAEGRKAEENQGKTEEKGEEKDVEMKE